MARTVAERHDVIPVLAEVFREHGVEGASLAVITAQTGLGKGSLYHFFPGGKDEMVRAVLENISTWFEDNIFSRLENPDDPKAAILATLSATDAYFHTGGRVCLVGALAVNNVRDRFFSEIQSYFNRWMDLLARTLQRQLAYAASHDSLTGLANRANFHSTMREMVEEVGKDENIEHQLLFVDLDRFKEVNDTAGHGAGDALLKKISGALHESVRRSDFVARLGGDEFALILKYCNVDTAVRHAEKIVSAIAGLDFDWDGQRFSVGASIGIAAINQDAGAVDEIVARADRGCYDAKSSGRGTVSVYRPEAA